MIAPRPWFDKTTPVRTRRSYTRKIQYSGYPQPDQGIVFSSVAVTTLGAELPVCIPEMALDIDKLWALVGELVHGQQTRTQTRGREHEGSGADGASSGREARGTEEAAAAAAEDRHEDTLKARQYLEPWLDSLFTTLFADLHALGSWLARSEVGHRPRNPRVTRQRIDRRLALL